ncbi:glycosyltransferase [Georgenia sp. TF02-10]|uniref:glycosyltransferase n=1 Tax=Georgenia sp. TF02-10 TaxID=2917725 RepID=UPI001FA714D6|nr:glycosyltransferase [Georgenia sp. TF02-10]UNX56038.1 glycosyltransferase [Georgenia sp. TF02-10]
MRVLQLTGSSAGGVARHVREVSVLLAAGDRRLGTLPAPGQRADRVVLAGPADVLAPLAEESGPGTHQVRTAVVDLADRPRPADARALARTRSLARRADVVHAHGLRAGALAAAALATLPRRPRLVVTLHNLPVGGPRVRAVAAVLERVVARRADAVLAVSGDIADRLRRLGARRVERALVPAPRRPATTDPAAARRGLGAQDGERLVLTVARLAPQKGLDLLAATARLLADGPAPGRHAAAAPPWRWVVVGDGPLRDRTAAAVAGLPVHLAGRREDVPDLLAAADVVVSTAAWEGQPLWLQEALALGAPVVATDVGGTREVTGDAAVLVPGGEPAALAEAVRTVLADGARRAALAAAARARAAELPTGADVLAQLRRVYAA